MTVTKARSYRDVHHGEIVKMLHTYGGFTRSQETGKYSQTEPGSADIMLHLRGGCAIEVKTGFNGTFRFKDWRENQREWATEYVKNTLNFYWLAIVFEGMEECPFSSLRNPKHAFLLPEARVWDAEETFMTLQESFPYKAKKGMLREIQENNLDAVTLWKDYGLLWQPRLGWQIPETHLFYKTYVDPFSDEQ